MGGRADPGPRSHAEAGLRRFAQQLLERLYVQVVERLEAHAALADAGLRQLLLVALRDVAALVGGAGVQRDVRLVAGQTDAAPVALAPARILEVAGAVP